MDDEETHKRKVWLDTFRSALQAQLTLGQLMMKVDQSLLTNEERAEFQDIFDRAAAQFKAVGQVMASVASDDIYKQGLASSELLLEETRRAIALIERILIRQGSDH